MTKKNQIKFPEKKNFQFLQLPKTTQKIPQQQQQKKFCHTPQFFFTSNEQDTRKKKK